jgi:glucose/mannose-6-phosphate isomerase
VSIDVDEALLDDVAALEAADRGGMLRAVAGSAAQVRAAATTAHEADLGGLLDGRRPRAIVVAGMGGSGIAGDVLAAVAGPTSPTLVSVHRGHGLPGWVGAADLVVAVSYSGTTEETLSAAEEAARRGAPILAVAAEESPLADLARQARGVVVPVLRGHSPRASMWALATPLVVLGDALGLLPAGPTVLEATAERLASIAVRCRPTSESFVNPGKELALGLAGSLPMVCGASPVAVTAAYRMTCQLSENAKTPALWAALPEAAHNAVVAFDGRWAGAAEDLFADPGTVPPRLHLLLLRDPEEAPRVGARAEASADLAVDRGVAVTSIVAEGASAYERLASLVGVLDYASVYLALLTGVDPTPVGPIDALKDRLAGQ